MFEAKKSFAAARGLAGGAAACNGRGSVRRILRDLPSPWRRFYSTAKHGSPPASRKNSRNGPAGRHRRPPRTNRRKGSRSLLGMAPGNGGAWRFPRRARATARIRRGLDYARRSEGFLPGRAFGQEGPAGFQRRRCRAKLRVRRPVFAAMHAKSSGVYRTRAVPATQGRDRNRDRMRENRPPFAPRRRGLAPSIASQGRLRMGEHRLRHGEQGGTVASRKETLEGNCGFRPRPFRRRQGLSAQRLADGAAFWLDRSRRSPSTR